MDREPGIRERLWALGQPAHAVAPRDEDPMAQVLASQALCRVFQIVAGGTGTPSQIAKVLGTSKHAVSQHLAALREVELLEPTQHPSGDKRRRFYTPVRSTIGQLFAHDHAVELVLFHDHLLQGQDPGRSGDRLAVSGTGRILQVTDSSPSSPPEPVALAEADKTLRHAVWAFSELFFTYLAARAYPTLRGYLKGAYDELVRDATTLDESPLARFARFQAEHAQGRAPMRELLATALEAPASPPPEPAGDEAPGRLDTVRTGHVVGRETADGTYVLDPEVRASLGPGTELTLFPSHVHPGRWG